MPPLFSRPAGRLCAVLAVGIPLALAGCSSQEDRAQTYYEDGVKFLAHRELQKAAIEFKNAVRLKNDMIPAWRELAQIEETQHHWESLLPILQTIVDLDPKDVKTKLKLARLMLLAGTPEKALSLVDSLDDGVIGNAAALSLKAAIFFRLKDKDKAITAAKAALDIDPSEPDARMVLAADRLDAGDAKGALGILQDAAIASTDNLGVQLFKLQILEKLGDLAQVEALLRKLTELYPKEIGLRKQLAKIYLDQDRQDDAEGELRAAVVAIPSSSEAEIELVNLLYAIKGASAARAELVARINTDGDAFLYQMKLAELDYAQQNYEDSFKLLQRLANNARSPEQALKAKLRLSELYIRSKKLDAAANLLSEVFNGEGLNTAELRGSALQLRGSLYLERGQPEAAVGDLQEALNLQPQSVKLMSQLAIACERSGSMSLAEKQLATAVKTSNFDPVVGLDYAAFLLRRGNMGRADYVLDDLLSRQPKNLAILSALADNKLREQDWTSAEEIADTISRIGDANGLANMILGSALSGQHKDGESIAAYRAAASAAQSSTQPMSSLVRALVRAKRTDEAILFLQAALKKDSANAETYILLGWIYSVLSEPEKSLQYLRQAIEKQPKEPLGYQTLADFYLEQKNTEAALATIRDGLKQQPDSINLHMALGSVLEQTGDFERAISEYEHVLTQQPGYLVAANNLASLLADHRADQSSLEQAHALAAALRQSPVPEFKDTLGWVAYRRGDFLAATPLLEQAATALPERALVHYHLGMTYAAIHRDSQASTELETALAKDSDGKLKSMIKAEITKIEENRPESSSN